MSFSKIKVPKSSRVVNEHEISYLISTFKPLLVYVIFKNFLTKYDGVSRPSVLISISNKTLSFSFFF